MEDQILATPENRSNDELLAKLELEIQHVVNSSGDVEEARRCLREWLRAHIGDSNHDKSIGDLLAELSKTSAINKLVAVVILRCLDVPGLLPESNSRNNLELSIVNLCEGTIPDLVRFMRIDVHEQTYIKFEKISDCHHKIRELLSPMLAPFTDLDAAMNSRKRVLAALNHGIVGSYGSTFNIQQIKAIVEDIYFKLKTVESVGKTLLIDIEACYKSIEDGKDIIIENGSFLAYDFLKPFLENSKITLDNFIQSSKAKFATNIGPCYTSELQKRHPFHETGREIQISIPFKNSGPGLATNVKVTAIVDNDSLALNNSSIYLGNVMPGEFSVILDIMVVAPVEKCCVILAFEWGEIGANETRKGEFDVTVLAQSKDIDWTNIEHWSPYSKAPAEGKDFVGRLDKLRTLAGKLLCMPMESFYVTGQKRVGKTSLVLAALHFAKTNSPTQSILYKNILWGSIAHEDPHASLNALGKSIEDLIRSSSEDLRVVEATQYSGSLSPLINLCETASRIMPDKRFVVVIDEFDEIHQELYLYGNLAETFFANLRALSRCKNFCLVLVGGENMPYIMERQGQKLNNFSRINLNYYARDKEWADFTLLVQSPSAGIINWHADAVAEIFNISNGNPYFAKIICAAVLRRAIQQRDADVVAAEVKNAIESEVSSLGSNSFVHLWQDGIPKPTAERELDILIRVRTLVSIARCSRKRLTITLDNITNNRGPNAIAKHEISAVLNDLVRREVLHERDQSYHFTLPIFHKWLVDVGAYYLAVDWLSAELVQAALEEDRIALVKSEEVTELARKWPTYRGRHIAPDDIRSWFEQVPNPIDQRLLFEILKRVRFYSESKIREQLKHAHGIISPILPEFIIKRRSDRRRDVIITYIDGEGKSGSTYAALYAEENKISSSVIFPPSEFKKHVNSHLSSGDPIGAIVIVDDIAATGESLLVNVEKFIENHSDIIKHNSIPIRVISLLATPKAQQHILCGFQKIEDIDIDFRTCEPLSEDAKAFPEVGEIGISKDWYERSKALCVDLGAKIFNKQSPLGYGGLGLLVVFPTNTPNNSLPILHSYARAGSGLSWTPIFPRVTH